MLTIAQGSFGNADWATLIGYFILLGLTGWWFNRRQQKGTEDYFLAGRRMPVWAVAISILASAQSAATFVGAPQLSYLGDMSYLSSNIGNVIGAVVLALVFIPAFYRLNVFTPYQLLGTRFGPAAKTAGSLTFLIGRVFANGSRTYIGAIPASLVIFGDSTTEHLLITVVIVTVVGIAYSVVGGAGSVIFTDVIQATVYLGAAVLAMGLLFWRIPVGVGEIWGVLMGEGKLAVVHAGIDVGKPGLGFDPTQQFTLLTSVLCFSLMTIASHGADNDLVARQLACKTPRQAAWSVVSGVLIGIPSVLVFLTIGLLLYIFYQRPDLMGAHAPGYKVDDSRQVFVNFILHEMPPGIAGLMMAGLFAASLSTINSALNAMSSAWVNDLVKMWRPGLDEARYVWAGRWGVVLWGVLVGAFSCICIPLQKQMGKSLIDFALSVMVFAYGGLLGVFLCALFTRRGNQWSAVAALVIGFGVVVAMQKGVWEHWIVHMPFANESWAGVVIAFPWQLLIGTIAAFLVCCALPGKGDVKARMAGA